MQFNLTWLKRFFKKPEKNELLEILYSYKKIFYWLLFFSALINFILIVPALYMFQIYDSVLTSRSFETLLVLTFIAVFFYLVMSFLEWVRSQILVRLSNDFDDKLSDRTFQASFSAIINSGSIAPSQHFNDLTTLRQFLTGTGIFAFFDSPWAFIYLVVIFIIHPMLGLFALGAQIVIFSTAIVSEYITKKPIQEANKAYQLANIFLQTSLRNAEVIEAMGMHENIKRKWRERYNKVIVLQTEASEKAGRIQSINRFIRISAQSLILGLGAYLAIHNIITPGMMIMGSILMGRALSPVDMAVGAWKQFVSARQSYRRLEELFTSYPLPEKRLPLPVPTGKLKVENVVVVPPGSNKEVLKAVNFEANPGEIIAIIGPTASGKSSLAKTIVGVWKPFIGSIKLDGADLRLYNKEQLGKYIGYLPQDIEIFSGTVAENIARFGEINMELVIKAAMIAGVHEMILNFPNGYETEVGEAGGYLSGGQRQRIALARAIYGDPVLIVLDEPNSNLDEEGETALTRALMLLKKMNKTILVISHKMNILSISDKIMLVGGGGIQLFGPREEIMEILKRAEIAGREKIKRG
jgi:ATP-binding cassette subfamily C exporter for protease/lipase/ATP-binding cassette subfamily C protein EexD